MLCKKTFRWVSFCGRRGWTWSSTFLDEVTFYAVDLVQHIGLPGVWGAQSLDQVQALKCDLVQIPLGPAGSRS